VIQQRVPNHQEGYTPGEPQSLKMAEIIDVLRKKGIS